MAERTRILIVGAGAIGCFYGSRLHDPAHNVHVSLVCRSNFKVISAAKGVRMKTHSFGDYFFEPEFVFPSIEASGEKNVRWDYVVVSTKALPDVSDDSARLEPLRGGLKGDGGWCLVLIQNGVGVEAPYRERFGPGLDILTAVTVANAEQIEDGVIHQKQWTRINVAPYTNAVGDASSSTPARKGKAAEFVELLKTGGIPDAKENTEDQMQAIRWHKVAINAAMNPSSVLSGGPFNNEMVSDPELHVHLREVILEVFRGAEAVLGLGLGGFPPKEMKMATANQILDSVERSNNVRPSMLGDWEKGSRMELEVILGNPIRAAQVKGVDMPRLHSMYSLLKMAQRRRDDKAKRQSSSKL